MFVRVKDLFMETAVTIENLSKILHSYRQKNQTIGFVPTMGALHEGHLQLIREAQKETDCVVCSIYVNPIQFTNAADLEKYPRQLELDSQMLERVGCSVLFAPTNQVMYPMAPQLVCHFGYLEETMEGVYRKNHFHGVAVVVSKLFHIVQPNIAYFGQKDLQQFVIIKQLVSDLSFPLQLRCIPTIRDKSGLALSSRNKRLTAEQVQIASCLYKWLKKGEEILVQTRSVSKATHFIDDELRHQSDIRLDYFQLVDAETLQPVINLENHKRVAFCIAAYVGDVRLIDNIIIAV